MFQNNLLMAAASISAGGITVDNSVRFNPADSPRLYRTPIVAGNRMTGSLSLWYKRGNVGSIQQLFNAGAGDDITFNASDQLTFIDSSGVSYITTQVFRDPAAWGHLLFAWDTTLTTAGDRLRIYHNGVEITAFATETNPSLGDEFEISNTVRQTIGANESNTEEFDGYLSQVYYIDGQQLTPTSFGEFNTNNVWRPIEYSATTTTPAISQVSSDSSAVNATTFTFSSQALGAAAADRRIVVCAGGQGGGGTTLPSAITVGGVSATFVVESGADSETLCAIWWAEVPTGTTGDVVVTFPTTKGNCGIVCYRLTGADIVLSTASQTAVGSGAASTGTVGSTGNSVVIGQLYLLGTAANRTTTWSGLTEDTDAVTEPFASQSTASATITDSTVTVSATPSGATSQEVFTLASFGSSAYGINGFKLDFADANNFGLDAAGAAISSTTYRYLKCQITDVESTTYMGIGEMEYFVGTTLYPTQTMTSDTLPVPLVASATNGTGASAAFAAFDDTDSSGGGSNWLSTLGTVTGFLKIDLGSGNGIAPTRIGITAPATRNRAPLDFTIQGSNDDSDYTVLATYASNTSWTEDETRNWPVSNGNNFADAGLATNDQVTDTPTNNKCVLTSSMATVRTTLSDGNLVTTANTSVFAYCWSWGTIPLPPTGKWAFEATMGPSLAHGLVGVCQRGDNITTNMTYDGYFYNVGTGYVIKNAANLVDVGVAASGSLIRCEVDMDADTMTLFDDDVEIFPAATGTSNVMGLTGQNTLNFLVAPNISGRLFTANFGPLADTPTAGYLELNTTNIPAPTILDGTANFQTTLYTGNGSVRNIDQTENSTFQPDWVWIKNRSTTDNHMLIDIARGVTKEINSDDSTLQTTDANGLTSFDSDGFGLGTGAGGYNDNTESFVAWQWLAGGGIGSSNTDGTINTTTTTVNTTAGFSCSTYTGNGTDPATIGHGLGSKPKMIIGKSLTGEANSWRVGFDVLGWTKAMYLDGTAAPYTLEQYWNNTDPTSTVWTTTDHNGLNGNTYTYVVYCFIDVEGFSKFGAYTGNGNADGPQTYLSFKPAWVMLKKTSGTGSWVIYDNQRSPYNEIDDQLEADTVTAETTGSEEIDFLSNGFKIRTLDSDVNTSSGKYVYAAFAEYPFGGVDITPATTF